jgi:phage protein D
MSSINAPDFKLTLGTTDFTDDLKSAVISIEVEQVSDGASSFRVELDDYYADFADGKKEIKEGMSAQIELGYEGTGTKKVIEGIITGIGTRRQGGSVHYVVTGFDGLQALTRGRKRRSWEDMKDSDIASDIAGECGLEADVEDSGIVNPYVAQNNRTNLDFLMERARRVGFELKVEEKRLVFKKPDFSSDSVATLCWDVKNCDPDDEKSVLLARCDLRSSTRGVVKKVVVRSYDPASAKEIVGSAETIDGGTMGGSSNAADAAASNNPDTTIQISNIPVASQEEAERIAASILNERANSFMTGRALCDGCSDICCGKKVTFKGLGNGLDGEYYVTSAKHTFKTGSTGNNFGYRTEITVGRSGR